MKTLANIVLLALCSALALVSAGTIQEPSVVDAAGLEARNETAVLDADLDAHSLDKRNGMLYCGNFATGKRGTASGMLTGLKNANKGHDIFPHSCIRLGCKDTTGIYVCNDRDKMLKVSGAEIYKHGQNIETMCCFKTDTGANLWEDFIGGQQFTDALGGGWNVVIGYANCNHSPTQKPSEIGGWGVNPNCMRTQHYLGK